jgi:putative transposase
MDWVRILAYVTGMVDQELLARNEYLAAENRILKAQSKGRLQLSDADRRVSGCEKKIRVFLASFSVRFM